MEVQSHISDALIALAKASQALAQAKPLAPPPRERAEGLQVTLTDEANPVRVASEECYMDLSFREAAALMLTLHNISQVSEYAEELQNG